LAKTLLEIWQTHIRPIYRALLFGFDEVHELCEESIAPLFQDPFWFLNLNNISTKILKLLLSTTSSEAYDEIDEVSVEDSHVWPKLQEDISIQALYQKSFELDASSLDAHRGIVCAVQLNDDFALLPKCLGDFDSLFLRESFACPFPRSFKVNQYQQSFIEAATKRQAEITEGSTVSHEDLDDLIQLGRIWGLDKGHILTQFLIVMYELGRDDVVEDFFTSVARLLDIELFLAHGIAIVCVRLSTALSILRKAKQCRSILALLDADTCEWVREQARTTCAENPDIVVTQEDGTLVPLESTHGLILRMKRMSSVNRIDAYALSVMCETLLKAMEFIDNV
jgi:hypothetical protein